MTTANTLAALVNSSSQVVVPSGGINFGTTTDGTGTVSSGVMDDYEQGTFSSTLTYNTNTTSATAGDGSQTTTGISSKYVKIGGYVFVTFPALSKSTHTGNSDAKLIKLSLPFTATETGVSIVTGYNLYGRYTTTAMSYAQNYIYAGANTALATFASDAGTSSGGSGFVIITNSTMPISISYRV